MHRAVIIFLDLSLWIVKVSSTFKQRTMPRFPLVEEGFITNIHGTSDEFFIKIYSYLAISSRVLLLFSPSLEPLENEEFLQN